MLVSVHLPKTAGTSFRSALEAHFGLACVRDYGDLPINTPEPERHIAAIRASLENAERDLSGVECIHGHFLPVKYLLVADRRPTAFVSWFREPVERLVSHYAFWQRLAETDRSAPLVRRMMDERWSLEDFCFSKELRNCYAQFLWAFPLERFDFIGITESYAEDLTAFSKRFLGVELPHREENVGSSVGRRYSLEPALRRRIEDFHAADMDLYERALEMRRRRWPGSFTKAGLKDVSGE